MWIAKCIVRIKYLSQEHSARAVLLRLPGHFDLKSNAMIVGSTHLPQIRQTTKKGEASLKESVKTFIKYAKKNVKVNSPWFATVWCKTSLRAKKSEIRKKTCCGNSASSSEFVRKKILSFLLTVIHFLRRLSKARGNYITRRMLISRMEPKGEILSLIVISYKSQSGCCL